MPFRLLLLFLALSASPFPISAAEPAPGPSNTLSLEFSADNAANILRNVAELFELNVVIPPAVQDIPVTIKLRDVTWRQIFDAVLAETDYFFIEQGNVIIVLHRDNLASELVRLRDELAKVKRERDQYAKVMTLLFGDAALVNNTAVRSALQARLAAGPVTGGALAAEISQVALAR